MATTATQTKPNTSAIINYVVNCLDGAFSEEMILNARNACFRKVCNFRSPSSGKKVSEVLNQEQIGEILNELEDIQFNRRISAKVARAGEAQF